MRPIELTIEGFRSYKESTTFDFRKRDLVGIVGPIGSGKSAILDAISFALYGRTPTVSQGTRELINRRSSQGKVELIFRSSGRGWLAQRVLRGSKSGAGQVSLYEYDLERSTKGRLVVEKSREMNERIETIVGVDFDGFTRSILLAQGRFAEFLSARAADRDVVLKGVFGLDRIDLMREQTATLLGEMRAKVENLQVTHAEFVAAGLELELLEKSHLEIKAIVSNLNSFLPTMREFDEQELYIHKKMEELERRQSELLGSANSLPSAGESEELFQVVDIWREKESVSVKNIEETQRKLDLENHRHKALVLDLPSDEQLQSLKKIISDSSVISAELSVQRETIRSKTAELKAISQEVDSNRQEVASIDRQINESTRSTSESEKLLETAQAAVKAEQIADRAGALLNDIQVGDKCPVCGEIITTLPETTTSDDLSKAISHFEEINTAYLKSRDELDAFGKSKALLDRSIELKSDTAEQLAREVDDLNRIVDEKESMMTESITVATRQYHQLGTLEDLSQYVLSIEKQIINSMDLVRKAEELSLSARDERENIRNDRDKARAQLQSLTNQLMLLAAKLPGINTDDLAEKEFSDARVVRVLRDQIRTEWKTENDRVMTEIEGVIAEKNVLSQKLSRELARAFPDNEIHDRRTFDVLLGEERDKLVKASGQIELIRSKVERAEGIGDELQKQQQYLESFEALRRDLTDSRFVRFLLEGERTELARLASETYSVLSNGRYSFTRDGNFNVVDGSIDGTERSARTLSGGETFLASLSLAIALSEMVTREDGRLEAFFLDEGFGTLDEEHLDLAMSGIEQLTSGEGDRLVLLVSHVASLRDRLEDVIELARDVNNGNTIVLSGLKGPN